MRRVLTTGMHRPVAVAVCAAAVGIAFYAFLRAQPAAFLPIGWHRPLTHDLPALVTGGLPTFVHALAMSLTTAAVLGLTSDGARGATCAAWCAVEIVFEAAQHPAVGAPLLAALSSAFSGSGVLTAIANFVRTGTFDPLDLGAAAFGSAVAYALLVRSNRAAAPQPSHAMHFQGGRS